MPAATTSLMPLATLAIGFVMAMLDVTVVNVALPGIAAQFGVPLTDLVWIADAYTLASRRCCSRPARWPTATGPRPSTRRDWPCSRWPRCCAAWRPTAPR